MGRPRLLAYSIYYWPEVASTAQIYTELFEALSDCYDIDVVCAVPCYTGEVPPEYSENRVYVEGHGGVSAVRVPVRAFDKRDKAQRVVNILDFWRGARRVTRDLSASATYNLVFTYSQPPVLGGMLGAYGARVTGAPFVYGVQDFNPEQVMAVGYGGGALVHGAMMALDKRTCRAAACMVVPGRDMAETLSSRFGGRDVPHCEVINNWADDDTIVPLPKGDPGVEAWRERHELSGKFVVMYSGNLGLYYDLPGIVRVLEAFREREDVTFAFVGEGAVKHELQEFVRSNGMGNVVFIPYQPQRELVYSLNAADVHLVTNARGIKGVSCPSKAYGVMAAGVPMLAVLESGSEVWRIVEESGCGECVEAGNYKSLKEAINRIISEKQDWVRCHRGGREYLDLHLSKKRAIEAYRELFQKTINNRND